MEHPEKPITSKEAVEACRKFYIELKKQINESEEQLRKAYNLAVAEQRENISNDSQPQDYGTNGMKGLGGKQLSPSEVEVIAKIDIEIAALQSKIKELRKKRKKVLSVNRTDILRKITEYEKRVCITSEEFKSELMWQEKFFKGFRELSVYFKWLVRAGDDRIKKSIIWEKCKRYELQQ